MSEALKYPIITIGREYCAYGRTIAAELSKRLGIPFYDKDFVQRTVIESGFEEEEVLKEGEHMTSFSRFLDDFLNGTAAYTSSFDRIYEAQKEVIVKLAQEGPCIIVGRCADHVLEENQIPSFHVFLYANLDFRLERAAELHPGKTKDQLKKIVKKQDELREIYYKHYTKEDIRYYKNYNICLDTGKIGVDNCVDLLENLIRA